MKRLISAAFFDYITGRASKTLARCWLIENNIGQKFGYTSHTRDLVFEGVTYYSSLGLQMSDLRSTEGGIPDTATIAAFLQLVGERALSAGAFDNAYMEIFLLNYHDLGLGKIIEKVGYLGELSRVDGFFSAELRGLSQVLDTKIGRLYGMSCDAVLGDDRCKVNLLGNADFFKQGTVQDVTNNGNFLISESYQDDFFAQGTLHFTSGLNKGFGRNIRLQKGDTIITFLPFPYDIAIGDAYDMTAGCDKQPGTCRNKFNNKINFRGFEFVPTNEDVFYSPVVTRRG